ncbi:MAG: hypothetical protein EPO40_00385 [Myxococcaceae bacterium]|nr:MAG: hypothetical protein EPO40_00385 [Myxococcaceae bacterium]
MTGKFFALGFLLLLACSSESSGTSPQQNDGGNDATTSGFCPLLRSACEGVFAGHGFAWRNSGTLSDAGVVRCGVNPLSCQYVPTADPSMLHRELYCSTNRSFAGVRFTLRFREPFFDLPIGRTLRLGVDFEVGRFELLEEDASGLGRPVAASSPILGSLTLTVVRPPKHISTGQMATIPTVRAVGQLCASPINLLLDEETRDDS